MRSVLTAIVVASVLSTGVGFALGQASDPPAASAAASPDAKYLKSIASQMKTLNGRMATVNRDLRSGFTGTGPAAGQSLADLNRSTGSHLGASIDDTNRLLLYICRSGFQSPTYGSCPAP